MTDALTPPLVLDGDHRYWRGGREYDGATAMLTAVGLIDTRWFTDEACQRGTFVHQAVELHLRGKLADDPSWWGAGYVEAARRFLRESDAQVLGIEQELADDVMGVAGRPDLWGYFYGKPGLPDWKTSAQPEPWHVLQGAIYRHLARVNKLFVEPLIDAFAVYLRDDGTYRVGLRATRHDDAVAQAVMTIANYQRAHR